MKKMHTIRRKLFYICEIIGIFKESGGIFYRKKQTKAPPQECDGAFVEVLPL